MKDNKALGIGYQVEEDKPYILASINFSKQKRNLRVGKDLPKEEVRPETPNPLTRKSFQETGGGKLTRETLDKPLRVTSVKMERNWQILSLRINRSSVKHCCDTNDTSS